MEKEDEISYGDMFAYLKEYAHKLPPSLRSFVASVYGTYEKKGELSQKQGAAIEKTYWNLRTRK